MIRLLDDHDCERIAQILLTQLEDTILATMPDATEREKGLAMATISKGLAVACSEAYSQILSDKAFTPRTRFA